LFVVLLFGLIVFYNQGYFNNRKAQKMGPNLKHKTDNDTFLNHHEYRHICDNCSRPEFTALYEIAALLTTDTNQQELLSWVVDILETHLKMERGTILLLLPDNTELVVQAAKNERRTVDDNIRYHRGEGIVGTVVETGQSLVIPDISSNPHFKNRIHRRTGTHEFKVSFICVPVMLEKEVVGTLSVDIPHGSDIDIKHSERIISIVASMIAGYLKTIRLVRFEREMWKVENERLRQELGEQFRPENIIGPSAPMQEVFRRIKLLSQSNTTVLIRGPSGTGKELIASAIHYSSKRKDMPLVKVNCAALSEHLIESELFGHERGSFSGAYTRRTGRIEEANGGTLFLDEIGDFSLNTQIKLLRVIQERQFERVGSNITQNVDIRLIAATNRDLESAINGNAFREDLYYRINVFPIQIPPLHERKEDIMPLVNHFVVHFSRKMGKYIKRVSTPAINMLMSYHWPGNVRELENCIEYAVLLSTDGVIYGHNLPPTLQSPDGTNLTATGGLRLRVETLERDMIVDALKRTNGNVSAAARDLEITPRMIRYKIKYLGIKPKQLSRPSRNSARNTSTS
jgi:Nif-specific regulatory protein